MLHIENKNRAGREVALVFIKATGVLVCLSASPFLHAARRQRRDDEDCFTFWGFTQLEGFAVRGRLPFVSCVFPGKVGLSKTAPEH